MTFEYTINRRRVRTGDIISTKDGTNSVISMGFTLLGALIPGQVDHTIIYLGPEGLCVEAGALGVITFNAGHEWNSEGMFRQRGLLDTFYAASSVLAHRGLSAQDEEDARLSVLDYVLGCVGKPYNINFLNPEGERAFYCSQLAYLAYKKVGIDLSLRRPGTSYGKLADRVVFPQDILDNSMVIREGV